MGAEEWGKGRVGDSVAQHTRERRATYRLATCGPHVSACERAPAAHPQPSLWPCCHSLSLPARSEAQRWRQWLHWARTPGQQAQRAPAAGAGNGSGQSGVTSCRGMAMEGAGQRSASSAGSACTSCIAWSRGVGGGVGTILWGDERQVSRLSVHHLQGHGMSKGHGVGETRGSRALNTAWGRRMPSPAGAVGPGSCGRAVVPPAPTEMHAYRPPPRPPTRASASCAWRTAARASSSMNLTGCASSRSW